MSRRSAEAEVVARARQLRTDADRMTRECGGRQPMQAAWMTLHATLLDLIAPLGRWLR